MMHPLPEPHPDNVVDQTLSVGDFDLLAIAVHTDGRFAPHGPDDNCGHTKEEHKALYGNITAEVLGVVATRMADPDPGRPDSSAELAWARGLDETGRAVLLQLAFQLTTSDEVPWTDPARALIDAGWPAPAFLFAMLGHGAHQTDLGGAIATGLCRDLTPREVLTLVRVAQSGADARGMSAEDVRAIFAMWDD